MSFEEWEQLVFARELNLRFGLTWTWLVILTIWVVFK